MTPERWQRIKGLLEQAESVSISERPALLDRLCEGDSGLRQELQSFLDDPGSDAFIRGVIANGVAELAPPGAPAASAHPHGVPIDRYCALLDCRSRLRLFLKVCAALEYAHRNLVTHGNLNPANILVTPDGEPKLLDFGIAALMRPDSATLAPDFASPEQAGSQPISVFSDLNSLAKVLYQLLKGCRLGEELYHIVLMALREDPERRYRSAQDLAEDIGRYLEHRPVRAMPQTITYRVRKHLRRHWVVMAASVLVCALISILACH